MKTRSKQNVCCMARKKTVLVRLIEESTNCVLLCALLCVLLCTTNCNLIVLVINQQFNSLINIISLPHDMITIPSTATYLHNFV